MGSVGGLAGYEVRLHLVYMGSYLGQEFIVAVSNGPNKAGI
jgi:hypothetical protein